MLDEENDNDESITDATDAALEAVAPLFREPTAAEQALLHQMHAWAERASHRPDSKAQCLIAWLERMLKPKGVWTDTRVIIFTEYRDTQHWLYDLLAREGFAEKGPDGEKRLLMLYGGMETSDRERIKAAFQANPADAAVRILLATDAASEGIDLQNHCSHLIHYEIPWNPETHTDHSQSKACPATVPGPYRAAYRPSPASRAVRAMEQTMQYQNR